MLDLTLLNLTMLNNVKFEKNMICLSQLVCSIYFVMVKKKYLYFSNQNHFKNELEYGMFKPNQKYNSRTLKNNRTNLT